jgi:hypothetical protein
MIQSTYISHIHMHTNGQSITFVNYDKYLCLIVDKGIEWKPNEEVRETNAHRIFIQV